MKSTATHQGSSMAATVKQSPQKSQFSDECMMMSPHSGGSSPDSEVNSQVTEVDPKSTEGNPGQRQKVNVSVEESQPSSNESDMSFESSQVIEVNWQIRKSQPGTKLVEVRPDLSSLRDSGSKTGLDQSSPKRKEVMVDQSQSQRHNQDDLQSQLLSQPSKKGKSILFEQSQLMDHDLGNNQGQPSSGREKMIVEQSQLQSQTSDEGKSIMVDQSQRSDLKLAEYQSQPLLDEESIMTEQSQAWWEGEDVMVDKSQPLNFPSKIIFGQPFLREEETMFEKSQPSQKGKEVADEESQFSKIEKIWSEEEAQALGFFIETEPDQPSSNGEMLMFEQSQPSRKGKEKMVDQDQLAACLYQMANEVREEQSQLFGLDLNMSSSQLSSNKENIMVERSQPSRKGKEVLVDQSQLSRKGKEVLVDQSQLYTCFSQKGKELMEGQSQTLGPHLERRPDQPSSSGKDMVDEFSLELEIKLQDWIAEYSSFGDLGQIMELRLQILLSDFLSKKMESTQEEVNYEELFVQLSIKGKEMLDYVHRQSFAEVNVDQSQFCIKSKLLEKSTVEEMAVCLAAYWRTQGMEVKENVDFRVLEQPLTFIRGAVRKLEGMDFPVDTLLVCARACMMFVGELTLRAWGHVAQDDRRVMTRSDVADAVAVTKEFEFLRDALPREAESDVEEVELPVAIGPRAAVAGQLERLPLLSSRFALPEEDGEADDESNE